MITRYRVSLGGNQMDQVIPAKKVADTKGGSSVALKTIDNGIVILDVQYSPMEKQMRQITNANLDGYDIVDTYNARRTVTVTFELHIYDIAERNEACQKINAWAQNGGTLRTNDRKGQILTVACQQLADISSAKNWTDPLTLVFVTERIPFWRSDSVTTTTITGKSAKGTLKLDGNTGSSLVTVTVTAKAKFTSLQLTVGSTTLKLTGLSVLKDKSLTVEYVRNRYLRIRADGSSVMSKLNPSSSDNLMAPCGASTSVSVTSDSNVTAEFSARGLWL